MSKKDLETKKTMLYTPIGIGWEKIFSVEQYLEVFKKIGINQGRKSETFSDKDIRTLLSFLKAENYMLPSTFFNSNSEIASLSKKIVTYGFKIKKDEIQAKCFNDLIFVYMRWLPRHQNNNQYGIWQLRYNFVLALNIFLKKYN